MFDDLKNGDIVITNKKHKILYYLNSNKKLLNLRIMNLKEFVNKYFGFYDERAIYYLVKKYNYNYDIAKMYLDNFWHIDKLKKELLDNDLIIENKLFRKSIKRIVIDNIAIDPYIKKEIDKYPQLNLEKKKGICYPDVYEFESIEDEINYVALDIIRLIKTVKPNQINLVNVGDEYKNPLKRIFKLYNIPIDLTEEKKLFATFLCQKFVKDLDVSFDKAINNLGLDIISEAIIDVVNKYRFKEFDEVIKYCIIEELKRKTIPLKRLSNAVNIVDIDNIVDDEYYYIMNFNMGVIPKIYKDEDFLSDDDKRKLGLLTTSTKNKLEKEKIKKIITSHENIKITYKIKENVYFKSPLLDEIKLNVKKIDLNDFNHSDLYNKLRLSEMLDNFIKFNEKDKYLSLLYSNYQDIDYLKYDNSYHKIAEEDLKKYLNNKLNLSYSTINNFYQCQFKFYINDILKIRDEEDRFETYIGNVIHQVLSKAFSDNFDFEKEFNKAIFSRDLSSKEKFFITKLKKDLIFIINTIKKQDENTMLKKALYEKDIYINKDRDIKITFLGKIDKIKYEEFDNKVIAAVIDYKTGSPNINIDNIIYGLDMQLPIYIYLIKNSKLSNVEIAGFYLQKILPAKEKYNLKKDYQTQIEEKLLLEGYSNNDEDILSKLDKSYSNSNMIKSMRLSSKGFYHYAKILSSNQINNIVEIVSNNIDNTITKILNTDFKINPKQIDNELIGCRYCKFKDICYRKEEDIVHLNKRSYKDFLGGENELD